MISRIILKLSHFIRRWPGQTFPGQILGGLIPGPWCTTQRRMPRWDGCECLFTESWLFLFYRSLQWTSGKSSNRGKLLSFPTSLNSYRYRKSLRNIFQEVLFWKLIINPLTLIVYDLRTASSIPIDLYHMSVKIVFRTKMFQDNDFLKKGHRPPLSSFRECFASIFRIHTETVKRDISLVIHQ